jgi:hypothetical protein
VVVRINVPEREPWAVTVVHRKTIPRPDAPMADTVMVVSVNVVIVIRMLDRMRPVVIDHSRRPARFVMVQTRALNLSAGDSRLVDYGRPLRRRGFSRWP